MKMDEKKIILYPSNWLYNAGVIGFLKVLEYNKIDFKIDEKILMDRSAIKQSYEGIFKYHKEVLQEKNGFKIWGKNKRYPNYIQHRQKEFFENYYIKALQNAEKNGNKRCSWCEGYFIPLDLLKKLEGKFSGKDFSTFLEQREKFQGIHFVGLGAAITEVPNSFWNLNFSIPICHLCSYLIIFSHLSFIPTSEGEIFINAPDFKLIWDLNRFAEEILKESKEYEIRKILGSSLLQWAIKRRALLGAWTMMNIEVIVKKRVRRNNKFENIIDYFDLPQHITKILLDYEIASLIERINEEKIFDLILSGKFSELEKVNYFVLKAILKLKNKEKISENDPIKKYFTNNELKYFQEVSRILPELYAKILKKLEVNMEEKEKEKEKEKINGLIEKLKKEGENVNVKEGLAQSINKSGFRLLEQVRLGNKDNVFYILLRCFAANEEKFPDELVEAFKPENEKYFKTLIFSFLAPILGKEETKGGEV